MPTENSVITREHLPGLLLARTIWENGGPSLYFPPALQDAIDQARAALPAPVSVPDGYMPIPTAEQLADALDNVRCFHDMSAELIAPELLANLLADPTVKESLSVAPSLPAAGSAVEEVEVVALVTPEKDRAITALTEAAAREDGGAMLSSVRPYSVPCMTVAQCLRMLDQLRAALSAQQSDPWAPSDADYDHAIHRNPDARAWADFFVATFPGQADKHDLMIGWFANAMMAMHDHLKAQQPEFCCKHSYKVAKQAAWGARDLTQCKCDHNEYCEHCCPDDFREGGKWHGGFETKQSAHVSVPMELVQRAARHLNDWLELDQCECEGPHYCGRTQVAATNRQLRALLNGGEA